MVGRSLIRFAPIPFEPPGKEPADWWFFYSPRAVEFAVEHLLQYDQRVKLAAMGPGTARALGQLAARFVPDFVGEGNPEEVAEAFGKIAAGKIVFFPRARQSRLTVQTILKDRITVQDTICYDNVAVPLLEPIAADVYVFTSPLNVAAYLDHQALPEEARIIAIGPSTGRALAARNVIFEMAKRPGEDAVVELLR